MILTLADKNILDDKGDLDDEEQDELENVLAVCHSNPLCIDACAEDPHIRAASCILPSAALEASFMQLPRHQSTCCFSAESDSLCANRPCLQNKVSVAECKVMNCG